jgi:AbiTii
MAQHRGLLGDIESDLLSDRPLADVLRKVVILGGRAGSAELREWASQELKGFFGVDTDKLPPYRIIVAPILANATTGSTHVQRQPIPYSGLPDYVREQMPEELPVRNGVGELEAWVKQGEPISISLPGAEVIAAHLDRASGNPFQNIYQLYWSISPVVVSGILDQIRTALAELVGELIAATPESQETPTREQAAQAVSVAVSGSKNRVTVTTQQSGASSSVATPPPEEEPTWWTRGRKIGAVVVGVFTIIGAIAAVLVLF